MHFILMTIEEWIELIIDAYNSGFLSSESEYKESLSYCLENAGFIVKDAVRNGELDQIYNEKIKRLKQVSCSYVRERMLLLSILQSTI